MITIAILARKGGVGKSTLATNCAACLAAHDPTVLLDIDPQATAAMWAQRRPSDGNLTVVATSPPLLRSAISEAQKHGNQYCLIDTPPHADSASMTAAEMADGVLVPVRPSQFDLDAMPATVQMLRLAGKPAAFIINAAQPQARHADLIEALSSAGIPVAPIMMRQRVAYVNAAAMGLGVTEGEDAKAADEVKTLTDWMKSWLGNPS